MHEWLFQIGTTYVIAERVKPKRVCFHSALYYYCAYRPGRTGANTSGRGILSMQGLSYGVVRVDSENSLTSLTLQDCGQVLPGGKAADKYCLDMRLRTNTAWR